ncbi:allophanate hydrolase [Teredinibacter waterburyi]|uniref:allophanate hydrolase n=1 Tax=Teredinibacter waterburyi TaxID=1500538 RepID=UPI00165FE682|nr:allophanate hydrolase [Teredinibacter waterburyi]
MGKRVSLNLDKIDLSIKGLAAHYCNGDFTPPDLLYALREKALQHADNPIWIHLLSETELGQQLNEFAEREQQAASEGRSLPLYGVPFAIKDNIDLVGIETTAACEAYRYLPTQNAFVVEQLIQAGAIPLGKTNMDQFATGLVGVRSPWGACRNALNPEFISGGSSSGSAVAVALNLVTFSLGTDTAGSGRVPASLNNIIGLKPSRGLLSARGVVPACKSLDCVSIFAQSIADANSVFDCGAVFDPLDGYARNNSYNNSKRYFNLPQKSLTLGIPSAKDLHFFGSAEAEKLFQQTLDQLRAAGFNLVEIDLAPFLDAAKLLYQGPWVSERYAAIENLIEQQPNALLPTIHTIISGGATPSAVDAFKAQYKLTELKQLALAELAKVDAIITPTNPRAYTIAEVEQNPIQLNANLGYYTNFMNLLDCAGLAIPCGFYSNGVGFGITLFHVAMQDKILLSAGAAIQRTITPSVQAHLDVSALAATPTPSNTVEVVVCGAHLDGLPLNWQLKERGGKLQQLTHTSEHYQFYSLKGGAVKRPALVRCANDENSRENGGVAIEVEVWSLPSENFGSFVNEIPAPLGIGKVELADGRWLTGFICDHWGLLGATDISPHGSWRNYLAFDPPL